MMVASSMSSSLVGVKLKLYQGLNLSANPPLCLINEVNIQLLIVNEFEQESACWCDWLDLTPSDPLRHSAAAWDIVWQAAHGHHTKIAKY